MHDNFVTNLRPVIHYVGRPSQTLKLMKCEKHNDSLGKMRERKGDYVN